MAFVSEMGAELISRFRQFFMGITFRLTVDIGFFMTAWMVYVCWTSASLRRFLRTILCMSAGPGYIAWNF